MAARTPPSPEKIRANLPTPENFESLGLVLQYGAFRLLDLGDLTWNQEHQLACPTNLLGTFDVFHTSRHGYREVSTPQTTLSSPRRSSIFLRARTQLAPENIPIRARHRRQDEQAQQQIEHAEIK